ncbi:MAG: hypothetical protein L3J41_02960 [Melioribacteraceae bacterium]|nr:hypothetical protein [Melioribacteraceae bacterium]
MARNGIITRIGRGKYTLSKKRIYIPEISRRAKLLNGRLKKQFPFSSACLWDTSILNEFAIHQANKTFLLIEVEKEITQSVFYFLTEKGYKVFIEPSKDIIDKYASRNNNYLIVKTLISEAPTQKVNNINTVTLEKLLVDIFCDKTIFLAYQGNEMKRIFSSAFKKYIVNGSKLLRYANRRGRKKEIENYTNLINGK